MENKNVTTTIIDPYDENTAVLHSNAESILKSSECKEKYAMMSDGSLIKGQNGKNLHILSIPETVVAIRFKSRFVYSGTENEVHKLWLSAAFYKSGYDEDNFDIYQYECFSAGRLTYSDFEDKKKWIVIPRDLFNDKNIYLYICSGSSKKISANDIEFYTYPTGNFYYYEKPVAMSLLENQSISDSRILLGEVKDENGNEVCGTFEWAEQSEDEKKAMVLKPDTVYKCFTASNLVFRLKNGGDVLKCPPITVNIYRKNRNTKAKSSLPGKDITAFVWQSGSENDRVRKQYLTDDKTEDFSGIYNTYRYILDSFSLGSVYSSISSLTLIKPEQAGKEAVRILAGQPEGYRCISIEGYLETLMGGYIRLAEEKAMDANNVYKKDKENGLEMARKNLEKAVLEVDSLYEICGSRFFYDICEKTIDEVENSDSISDKTKKYITRGLGINSTESGCERLKNIIRDIFKFISEAGVPVDYVYCDIEKINNEARSMKSRHRFLDKDYSEYESDYDKQAFAETVFSQIKTLKPDIYRDLLRRGYIVNNNKHPLYEVWKNNDSSNDKVADYGVHTDTAYHTRRNLNIWDAVMKSYVNDLMYKYVMEPVLSFYPGVKCSAYAHSMAAGYINQADRYETYLGGSVLLNPKMYSCVNLYGSYHSEYFKKLCMDNWKMPPNPKTAFSILVGHVNRLRAASISSERKTMAFICSNPAWTSSSFPVIPSDFSTEDRGYYKEYLYHVFLCNPDKVIAYFNTDCIADTEKPYYKTAYTELENVLEELNEIFMGEEYAPVDDSLALETEPFLISGVKTASGRIWRVTFDIFSWKKSKKDNSVCFYFSKNDNPGENNNIVEVEFPDAEIIEGFGESKYGYWIKTSEDTSPEISHKSNYYEMNPAYEQNKSDLESDLLIEKNKESSKFFIEKFNIFGEWAMNQTWEMEVKVPNVMGGTGKNGGISILHHSYSPAIRIDFMDGKINASCVDGDNKAFMELKPGEAYKFRRKFSFSNGSVQEKNQINDEVSFGNNTLYITESAVGLSDNRQAFFQTFNIASGNTDLCECGNLKIYPCGSNVKLELFRKRDGINITRVNRNMEIYSSLTENTAVYDYLIGKLSWLNASEQSVNYIIRYCYTSNDTEEPENTNVICKQSVEIGDEGYVTFELPEMPPDTMNVYLYLCEMKGENDEIVVEKYKIPIDNVITARLFVWKNGNENMVGHCVTESDAGYSATVEIKEISSNTNFITETKYAAHIVFEADEKYNFNVCSVLINDEAADIVEKDSKRVEVEYQFSVDTVSSLLKRTLSASDMIFFLKDLKVGKKLPLEQMKAKIAIGRKNSKGALNIISEGAAVITSGGKTSAKNINLEATVQPVKPLRNIENKLDDDILDEKKL